MTLLPSAASQQVDTRIAQYDYVTNEGNVLEHTENFGVRVWVRHSLTFEMVGLRYVNGTVTWQLVVILSALHSNS